MTVPVDDADVAALGLGDGRLLAVAIAPGRSIGLATGVARRTLATEDPVAVLAAVDARWSPRWIWWDRSTADLVAAAGVPVGRCWDVVAVHRLLVGGFRADVGRVWCHLNELDPDLMPTMGQLDLLQSADEGGDPEDPVRPDGYLRPEWLTGAWRDDTDRTARWAQLALDTASAQHTIIADRPDADRVRATANAESMTELLCAELAADGLPVDEAEALRIIGDIAGPRPTSLADEEREQHRRDADVLQHLDAAGELQPVNLRNPADVKAMLRRSGFDLPDTRAWRLEQLRDTSPLIDALLTWRKGERIATTYGYLWFDEHVSGGRLRGDWSSADGAAGRMTASAGLHNLPAPMRPAVAAEPGHRLVRADLGQIEPRVLAAVSGDPALIAATASDDLYRPVAERLGVERDVAKVAVLGALYGATTGESAGALRGLERSYPVAMAHLEEAAKRGQRGEDLTTVGGRRIRTGSGSAPDGDLDRAIAAAAARGRYARNALIQGAAAEFFKMWALIVRRRSAEHGARVVLCLHDELLVHAPADTATEVADLVTAAVDEAAFYWSPDPAVRFVTDTTVVERWSDAKG
ncbi:MAG: DNA polymerase [Actinomycetota bacterium]